MTWSRSLMHLFTKQNSNPGLQTFSLGVFPHTLATQSVVCRLAPLVSPKGLPAKQSLRLPQSSKSRVCILTRALSACVHVKVSKTQLSNSLPLSTALRPLHLTSDYFLRIPRKSNKINTIIVWKEHPLLKKVLW